MKPPAAEPLVDAHAHFLHAGCGRSDWAEVNAARMRAGKRIGNRAWEGAHGLEWEIPSPPPTENFAATPIVTESTHQYTPSREVGIV